MAYRITVVLKDELKKLIVKAANGRGFDRAGTYAARVLTDGIKADLAEARRKQER